MRVLWFNWRDINNPEAGGAEVLTHEVMRRLAKKNYNMTLFTERFANSLSVESLDGVKIIRDGTKYTVYRKAKEYYRKTKDDFDFIVDEINAKPFLTPRFVKEKPILALSHHVSLGAWVSELRFPLGHIGYYFHQRRGLSYYKNIPTATVSDSSKKILEKLGLKKIYVVPEGLNIRPLKQIPPKEPLPTIAFVGRLKRNKLPDHAIRAFSIIKASIPDARMWIIGDGYMRQGLEKMSSHDTTFYGHVNDKVKYDLLSKAHLVLVPGIHEGWGLVVTESNAMGTPAIAYNIPGLRDSVMDGETGILAKDNKPAGLAQAAISLLKDRKRLSKISLDALDSSRKFSWDNTADAFDNIINDMARKFAIVKLVPPSNNQATPGGQGLYY